MSEEDHRAQCAAFVDPAARGQPGNLGLWTQAAKALRALVVDEGALREGDLDQTLVLLLRKCHFVTAKRCMEAFGAECRARPAPFASPAAVLRARALAAIEANRDEYLAKKAAWRAKNPGRKHPDDPRNGDFRYDDRYHSQHAVKRKDDFSAGGRGKGRGKGRHVKGGRDKRGKSKGDRSNNDGKSSGSMKAKKPKSSSWGLKKKVRKPRNNN